MTGSAKYGRVLLILTTLAATAWGADVERYEFTQVQMGVPWKLTFYAADATTANMAAKAAFQRVEELNAVLSDYDPNSELSRLSRTSGTGKPVAVSQDLWNVLARSQALARETDGAFDVTVGPIVRLWRRARRMKEMPAAERLAEALQAVGYEAVELNAEERTVSLTKPEMRLDLGGIAMGYAADEALALLRKQGIHRAMVDASGDVTLGDPPPGASGWRVGVGAVADGKPSLYLSLANSAVTTSGDAFQYVEIEGIRYSHIVDPRTGLGLTDRTAVTVIAPDCVTADSLATAVSVLGPEKGLPLVENTPGAAAMIIRAAGEQPEVFQSERFKDLPTLK